MDQIDQHALLMWFNKSVATDMLQILDISKNYLHQLRIILNIIMTMMITISFFSFKTNVSEQC